MALGRRDFLKGAAGFLGAATAYETTRAGILLPAETLITAAPAEVSAHFDGFLTSVECNHDDLWGTRGRAEVEIIGDVTTYESYYDGLTQNRRAKVWITFD